MTAGNRGEIRVADFYRDGPRQQRPPLEPGDGVMRHVREFVADRIEVESDLPGTYSLSRMTSSLDGPRPDAHRCRWQSCFSQSAMLPTASRRAWSSTVRTSIRPMNPSRPQLLRGDGTNAPESIDRKPLQEGLDAIGRNDRQAVRLFPSRRNFRQELVRRNSRGGSQTGRVADAFLQSFRDLGRSGSFQLFSVTSRYASSSDSGSTSGVTSR